MAWRKINSEYFRWDNSVRANQIGMQYIFNDHSTDDMSIKLLPGIKVVGYCMAHSLKALPADEGYAVMLEFSDGTEYWVHNLEKVKESDEQN
jgi:hypothetical protein